MSCDPSCFTCRSKLADRIRSIANLVDRTGVYDLLHDLADELDADGYPSVTDEP
jgi:hypothetical protein